MNVRELISSVNIVDVVIVLFLFAWLIIGWAQGAVRRLIGVLTMTFSFLLASQLQLPLGEFLAANWVQYPRAYAFMLGFLTLFLAGMAAFFLVAQGTYRRMEVLAKHPIVDEVLGGVLGVAQGALFLLFGVVVLDQFFLSGQAYPIDQDELMVLRSLWEAIDGSRIGETLHATAIPNLLRIVSLVVPQSVLATYDLG